MLIFLASHFQIHIPIEQRISNNAPLLSATHQLPLTQHH